MVEGGCIDKAAHVNDLQRAVGEVLGLEAAVREILAWAAGRTDPTDTLVLVLVDHETGGLSVKDRVAAGTYPAVTWIGTDHTAANVPVYAWGPNAEKVLQVLDNTEMSDVAKESSVRLTSPADGAVLGSTTVAFAARAEDPAGLTGASLWVGTPTETATFSGPSQCEDAQIDATYPNTNYGSAASINIDGATPHAHGVMRFPGLLGTVPPGSTVTSATLKVNCTNLGNAMKIYRLTEDWSEGGATWSSRLPGTAWTNAGADGSTSHAATAFTADCSATGWRTFDITALVQEWASGAANLGIVLVDGGADGIDFDSSESANPPVLTVQYSTWSLVETVPLSGTAASIGFAPLTEAAGGYRWNCLVTNAAGKASWAAADARFTVDPATLFPAPPVLVGPLDGATGVGLSTALQVAVSDPNLGTLDVSFYGAGADDGKEFVLAVLPDTQIYSKTYPAIFTAQTRWIAENAAALNIVFVAHEGDITDTYTPAPVVQEWVNADTSMSLLDGVVPYAMAPGNHDVLAGLFNDYFPYTRYASQPWYGGHYPETGNDNSYGLFSAGGDDYIILHLRYAPDTATIAWADAVLETHRARKAIIVTHSYLTTSGSRTAEGTTIWNGLVVPNDNVLLVLCGHEPGEAVRTDRIGERDVHQVLADFQSWTNGGNGYLRLLRFSPAEGLIHVETYSPHLNSYEVDANSRFDLKFPMSPRRLLGTVRGLQSGLTATFAWPDLDVRSAYEWSVKVADPSGNVQPGPVWTFRTGSGDATPPAITGVAAAATDTGATVTWTTDEPADSLVEYRVLGSTGAYSTASDSALVAAHSIVLTGLTPGTDYEYRVTSEDAAGNPATSAGATFRTDLPPVAQDQAENVDEDGAVEITLAATDGDPGDVLSYAIAGGPEHGTLTGTPPAVTYAPAADWNGTDTFTFTATDPGGVFDSATVTITVAPVNDAPSAAADAYSVDQDTPLDVGASGVLGNDTDPDSGDVLTASGGAVAHGTLALAADGSFTYTPETGYVGPDSFTYTATDSGGLTSTATVSITVLKTNHAPIAVADSYSVTEDGTLDVSALIGVLANDSDPDTSDVLTAVLGSGTAHGTLTLDASGSFLYAPATNYNGTDSFTYRASDGRAESGLVTVSITVTSVDDAPVASDGAAGTAEDTAVAVTLSALDADGDAIGYAIVDGPAHGALTGTLPILTYTPGADWSGVDTFTFRATAGGVNSNIATVTVTVNPVNDAPVAGDLSVSTDEDTAVAFDLTASDVDSAVLTFAVVVGPAHGTLSGVAPSLTYTPVANYAGADAFTFRANDGAADSTPATVSITVGAVADAPSAPADLTAAAGSSSVTLGWTASADPDGDLAGYDVYRGTAAGGPYSKVNADTVTGTTYLDTGLANGTAYYYVVKAVDAAGSSSAASAEASATPDDTAHDAYAAENPTVTTGSLGSGNYTGTFEAGDGLVQTITEAPSGTGGRSALLAQYALHTTAAPEDVTSIVLHLSYTWTGGTTDALVISVWDGAAWGQPITLVDGSWTPASPAGYIGADGNILVRFADSVVAKGETKDVLAIDLLYAHVQAGPPDTTAPAAPAGVGATPYSAEVQVRLDWTANTEPDLAGYRVYRSTVSGSGYAEVTTSAVTATTYTDAVPGPGTYFYIVRAFDGAGNGSAGSTEVSAVVADLPPAAPAGLAATAGNGQVSLTWTANAEGDLAGYNVYRGETKLNTLGLVATASYQDSAVVNGTTYTYHVTAVDGAGHESTASSTVTATPSAQSLTVTVSAIDVTVTKVTSKNWQATAVVTVVDGGGTAKPGATVTGDWYYRGSLDQSGVTALTGADGMATFTSSAKPAKSGSEFRFEVTGVTLDGYTYVPGVTIGSIVVP